jgi:hypothetical protein
VRRFELKFAEMLRWGPPSFTQPLITIVYLLSFIIYFPIIHIIIL